MTPISLRFAVGVCLAALMAYTNVFPEVFFVLPRIYVVEITGFPDGPAEFPRALRLTLWLIRSRF